MNDARDSISNTTIEARARADVYVRTHISLFRALSCVFSPRFRLTTSRAIFFVFGLCASRLSASSPSRRPCYASMQRATVAGGSCEFGRARSKRRCGVVVSLRCRAPAVWTQIHAGRVSNTPSAARARRPCSVAADAAWRSVARCVGDARRLGCGRRRSRLPATQVHWWHVRGPRTVA